MNDQPLHPFSVPSIPFDLLNQLHVPANLLPASLSAGFSMGIAVTWVLYAVFAVWTLYTLVAVYHWLRYSHASWIAFPGLALHLYLSLALMSYALSGNAFLLTAYLP